MPNTSRLALPYLVAGQAQKEATHNDALNDLDSLAQISVINRTTATPPISPSDGDSYIIGSSPTGAWAGNANAIASYYTGWRIKTPKTGWLAYVQNEGVFYLYDGSAWNVYKEIAPLGSASAPSYSFIGDSNTGMYSPGADQIALATNGVQRMAIDASGNASFAASLTVAGTISGNLTGNVTGNVSGNASTVTTNANLSGDVSSVGNTTTIGAGKVTNTMLAGSIAASNLVGTDIATLGTITSGTWNAGAVTSSGAVTGTAFVPTGTSIPANGLYLLTSNTPAVSANSVLVARFNTASSGVNYVDFTSAATGGTVQISSNGSDADVTLAVQCRGLGGVSIDQNHGSSRRMALFNAVSTAVNYFSFTPAATGSGITLAAASGTDSNIDFTINAKGTGALKSISPLQLTTSVANALTAGQNGTTNPAFNVDASTASSVTGVSIKSAAAASGVQVQATSSGTDEPLILKPKGAAATRMYSASGVTSFPTSNPIMWVRNQDTTVNNTNSIGFYNSSAALVAQIGAVNEAQGGSGTGSIKFATYNAGTGSTVLQMDSNKNVVLNTAALATNATDGFLYIPSCAGTPTGTPTSFTGRVPLVYDSSNNKLYIYNGAWKSTTLT